MAGYRRSRLTTIVSAGWLLATVPSGATQSAATEAGSQPPAAPRVVDAREAAQPANAAIINGFQHVPEGGLARIGAIQVTAIRVDGSSVFTADELEAMTHAYTHRVVLLEELHELRQALSRAYVERGYVSSGVIIPDQRIENGVVALQAVEGELTAVEIHGNRRFRQHAILRRVRRHVDKPLHIESLQAGLRALQDEPLVERVNAQLLPGAGPGESYLRLAVAERPPFQLEVVGANDRSASVGENRGTLALAYRGLAGNGDVLTGRFGLTKGVRDHAIAYRVPVSPAGTLLDVLYADHAADIIEEPFDAIDIKSRLEQWSVTASHPFIRQPDRSLTATFALEHKRSESTLLGMPFSFSPGEVDGRARGSAVSVGVEWTRRYARQAWSARGTFQVGVDAVGATLNDDAPDTEFVTFLGQVQYLRRMSWRDSRLLVRGVTQLARDPLLAMYKMPVGGRYTVRGYRENLFVRDNGAAASIEYQFPPLSDETGRPRAQFNIAAFADYGVAWDEDDAVVTARRARIASAGLGLLWEPPPGFRAELYWGADLKSQNDTTRTLQDRGVHYRIGFRREF